MYAVVGIDPGTSCGWSVLQEDGGYSGSGVWDLSGSRFSGGGMRYLLFRRNFIQLLDSYQPSGMTVVVAYEEVRGHKGTDAAHIYGGIVGQLTEVCEDRQIPYQGVSVGTIKRMASGKGNCSKEDMTKAAHKRWYVEPQDDNEADALWVAETLLVELGFKRSWREE